jgi:chromosome segregation protein
VRLRQRVQPRRPDVAELLDTLFASAIVVEGSWRQAMEAALDHPELLVVTRQGDRFGGAGWRIGLSGTGATGAALEEAEGKAAFAKGEADRMAAALQAANTAARDAANRSRSIEDQRRQTASAYDKAVGLRDRSAAQTAEFDTDRQRLEDRRLEVSSQAQADQATARRLAAELPAVENEEAEYLNRVEALSLSRTSLEERARSIAHTRTELEVKAAAVDERREQLAKRQVETELRLERLVGEREQARVRRQTLEAGSAEVAALAERLGGLATRVAGWIELLEAEHRTQSETAREVAAELSTRRTERQGAERELVEVRERRSRVELGEAENRVKLEAITEALRRELDTEPSVAMATEAPEIEGEASPEARVRDLERELKLLGPINPLALEEFEALKERHDFIDAQLDDVKTARRDLNHLIRSIDEEIVGVFSAAYADVSTNFVTLFGSLFPGGKGGMTLTNPDDLLNCGVELEAKPSGKNVKKLSLLSGGERSLVALAFLFAVFRSRPSPFYVMDEVEAALDDVNLSRFLALMEEFRKEAQLIVVSHQKRTMEAADVLYGVSMKPGGSSRVVSEKVEGRKAASRPEIDLRDDRVMELRDDDQTDAVA